MSTSPHKNHSDDSAKPPLKESSVPSNSDLNVEILQQSVPKLPHETDQSTSNQETDIRPEMLQAGKDINAGVQDTGRLPVVHEVYKRQKR